MRSALIKNLSEATSLAPADFDSLVVVPKQREQGDFAMPCFVLAKAWGLKPPEAAMQLKEKLVLPEEFEKVEVVGPYLNFFRKRTPFVQQIVSGILERGSAVGAQHHAAETVIVEYSSPNIAKPFHIGHLRTTLIGHSLDRVLRHLGYNVISINHVGDWGTQFGFVYAGCLLWGRPEQGSIFDLVDLYIKATTLRKQQDENLVPAEHAQKPNVNELAREYFRRLEADDPEALEFWQWCYDVSFEYLDKLYKRLGVHFDFFTGESFYRNKLSDVENALKTSGILQDSKGALGVDLGKKLGFVRVFSDDGRSLYVTRDLAAADYRWKTFKPSKILYVVGAPQQLYFQQLIAVLERMQHPVSKTMVHVAFGNVPGISTRAGKGQEDRIWLDALLNEAHEGALSAYRQQVERRPTEVDETIVAESVGLGAVFFNYLCRSNIKEFNFSWEEALNFQGDTGPYIQYAFARLNSIKAKAGAVGLVPSSDFDPALVSDDASYGLVSMLARLDEVLAKVASDYEPYHLATFVLDLARAVSGSYSELRVIGEARPLSIARLSLFEACRITLQVGLQLLGVPPIERM